MVTLQALFGMQAVVTTGFQTSELSSRPAEVGEHEELLLAESTSLLQQLLWTFSELYNGAVLNGLHWDPISIVWHVIV